MLDNRQEFTHTGERREEELTSLESVSTTNGEEFGEPETLRKEEVGVLDHVLDSCEGGAENKNVIDNEDTMSDKSLSRELIMSEDSNRKSEEPKDDLLNRDEVVNHKNRRIVRQNLVSDVLLISDDIPRKRETPVVNRSSPEMEKTKEKKVKKVERPKSKPAPPPVTPLKINRDECDWDSLFDDNGDCLDPTLIEEVSGLHSPKRKKEIRS